MCTVKEPDDLTRESFKLLNSNEKNGFITKEIEKQNDSIFEDDDDDEEQRYVDFLMFKNKNANLIDRRNVRLLCD